MPSRPDPGQAFGEHARQAAPGVSACSEGHMAVPAHEESAGGLVPGRLNQPQETVAWEREARLGMQVQELCPDPHGPFSKSLAPRSWRS